MRPHGARTEAAGFKCPAYGAQVATTLAAWSTLADAMPLAGRLRSQLRSLAALLREHSGLIISIGEFVLRTACHQAKRLRDMGFMDFRVAVNISLAQFRHPQFIPRLQAAMRDAEVPGTALELELEITESMAMEDVDMVLHVLSDVSATGASVAIDDFGTGFSSLSQLRQLQVERLKIDRDFVQEAQSSSAGSSIAAMVVNLGRTLGMRVLADGIETEEQAQKLLQGVQLAAKRAVCLRPLEQSIRLCPSLENLNPFSTDSSQDPKPLHCHETWGSCVGWWRPD